MQGFEGLLGTILPFAVLFAVFYFFLIRPQQVQQRKQNATKHSGYLPFRP